MNKVVKYGAIGLGSCFLLFVVALIVFSVSFDPNDYKDRIVRAVKAQTGRTLTFDGDLELLVFPQLGVSMGGASLSNHPAFGTSPMVSVDSARVTVQTLPLLLGRINFGQLVLDGPVLNLGRKADGTSNWDDLVGRTDGQPSAAEPDQPFSLEVDGVSVTAGTMIWDDRKSDTRFTLTGVNVTTGRIYEGSLFPVDLRLDFDCTEPAASGSLSVTCKSALDLANREYNHMDMRVKLTASGEAIPGGQVDADAAFSFLAMNFNTELAQLTGFECAAYGATVHGDATLQGITDGVKALSATVTLDPADLRAVAAGLGTGFPETEDKDALTMVGGTAMIEYAPGRIELRSLEGEVDGTRVVGSGFVESGDPYPSWFARLDLGTLDLDRYLPPDHPDREQVAQDQARQGEGDDRLLPAEAIRHLNLDLEAKAAELKFGGAWFSAVRAVVRAKDGLLKVEPLSAELYGGTMKVTGVVDATGKTARTDLDATVAKLDVGALSKDVRGRADYAGIADFSTTLDCRGERARAMLQTLNGKLAFSLTDGVFPGVDLVSITRTTHSRKGDKGKVEGKDADSTEFGSITGTGTIKNGVLSNRDLEVKAPGLRADGNGAVSLVTREIDYMLKTKLVPQAGGQGGKSSDELFGVMVPIHVTGSVDQPYYWVSLSEYVKALGGVVVDTVGSVLGGVRDAVKGVGSALDSECCEDEPKSGTPKKSKFLGIF